MIMYIYIWPQPKIEAVFTDLSQQLERSPLVEFCLIFFSNEIGFQSPGLWCCFGLRWLLAPEAFRQGMIWQPQKDCQLSFWNEQLLNEVIGKTFVWCTKFKVPHICSHLHSHIYCILIAMITCIIIHVCTTLVSHKNTNTRITLILGATIRHGRSQTWELWAMCIQNVHHLQDCVQRFQREMADPYHQVIKLQKTVKHPLFVKPVASQNWTVIPKTLQSLKPMLLKSKWICLTSPNVSDTSRPFQLWEPPLPAGCWNWIINENTEPNDDPKTTSAVPLVFLPACPPGDFRHRSTNSHQAMDHGTPKLFWDPFHGAGWRSLSLSVSISIYCYPTIDHNI